MIQYNKDGTTLLVDEANTSRTQVLAANLSQAQRETAIATFFGPYVPSERDGFGEITPRQLVVALLSGFRNANKLTTGEQDSIRDFVIERLKR